MSARKKEVSKAPLAKAFHSRNDSDDALHLVYGGRLVVDGADLIAIKSGLCKERSTDLRVIFFSEACGKTRL